MSLFTRPPTAWPRNNHLVTAPKFTQEEKDSCTSPFLNADSLIAAARITLALCELLVLYHDPLEPVRYSLGTHFILICYVLGGYILYSTTLYMLVGHHQEPVQTVQNWSHWVDVGWHMVLVALSSTNSIFFFGFYFAVLTASFRWGFASGLRVTVVSTVFLTTNCFLSIFSSSAFEPSLFSYRPVYLLVLGCLTSYWGEVVLVLNRQLALLKEITALAASRFGVERTVGLIMKRLQVFYRANACSFIPSDQSTVRHPLFHKGDYRTNLGMPPNPIAEELAHVLGTLPATQAIVSCGVPHRWKWWCPWAHRPMHGILEGAQVLESQKTLGLLSTICAGTTLVIAPVRYRGETVAHLCLTARRRHAFRASDIDFLLQVGEHIMPILENLELADQLAANAAEEERRRIARDLHDSVVQPYLGLRMGLSAIHRKLAAGEIPNAREDLEHLIELANVEIANLRHYAYGLRTGNGIDRALLPAVRRFIAKFGKAAGMTIAVKAETDLCVNARLAADVFQMVVEGLSNIRRHTSARQASVDLACREKHLILEIENEGSGGWAPFTPRSITERAAALGGHAYVRRRDDGGTVVIVEVPL